MEQGGFINDLKHQYRHGGIAIRFIFINVAIFIVINIALVVGRLTSNELLVDDFLHTVFALETRLSFFIYRPWALITSFFAHFSIWHLLFNMLFLFFAGRMFEQLFDGKRLIYTYFIGGIAGGLLELLSHGIFPALQQSNTVVVGASGSIMAIFFAIAFHRPTLKVNLFGILPVQIIWLALAFLLLDFVNLGRADGTAHFAHLGGAIIGMISVQQLGKKSNLINTIQSLVEQLTSLFKPRKKLRVVHNQPRKESDEDFKTRKKNEQNEINRILEKISKSGYDSLSKSEKDFLFNQSKK